MKYSRVTGLALQQRRPAHVRFGSSATETVEATHAACPVCPQSPAHFESYMPSHGVLRNDADILFIGLHLGYWRFKGLLARFVR